MVLRSFGGNSIFVFSALYRSVFMLCKFSTSMRGESRFWSPKPFNFGETNLDCKHLVSLVHVSFQTVIDPFQGYKVIPNTIAIPQAGSLNANGAVVASALMYLGGRLTTHFQHQKSTHFQHRLTPTPRTHSQHQTLTHFQHKKHFSASRASRFSVSPLVLRRHFWNPIINKHYRENDQH